MHARVRPGTFLATTLVTLAVATASSATSWVRDYDLGTNVSFGPVAALPDGGVVLVADGQRGLGTWDTSVVRLDPLGRVAWHEIRGSGRGDRMVDVAVGEDGSLLLAGFTDGRGGLVERYGSDGTLEWARHVTDADGSSSVGWQAAIALPDGGWLLAGTRDAPASPPCDPVWPCTDALVARLDAAGNVVWVRALDAESQEAAVALALSSGGGALVAVHPDLVMAIASDGTLEWVTRLAVAPPTCPGADVPIRAIAASRDGGYIACGGGLACGVEHAWLINVEADGSMAWERRDEWPTTTDVEWGWGNVAELPDGRIAVQGRGRVALLAADGSEAWSRHVAHADHQWAFDGAMAVVGTDVVATWQWSRGLVRLGPDGDVGGDPCWPVDVSSLPGGLVPPGTATPATPTPRVPPPLSSRFAALDRLDTCADPSCVETCPGGELDCTDGVDDDADGAIDCADADCGMDPACAADSDSDGVLDHLDCAPFDPRAIAPPQLVVLAIKRDATTGDVSIGWQDQVGVAGDGTRHDVLRGSLADFSSSECVARGVEGLGTADGAGAPPGAWYLVRARNACGATDFGGPAEDSACD